jgi:hypothetical protein
MRSLLLALIQIAEPISRLPRVAKGIKRLLHKDGFCRVVIPATQAFLLVAPALAQGDEPKYGRPRYEVVNGYEWMFIVHKLGVDWYATTSQIKPTENGFTTFIRAVKPTQIDFGPLFVNCFEKRFSAYYEPYEPINMKQDNVVTRLAIDNCFSAK